MTENSSLRDDIFFIFVVLTVLPRTREEMNAQNLNTSFFQHETHFHLPQRLLPCCTISTVPENFSGVYLSLTGSQKLTPVPEKKIRRDLVKKKCEMVLFLPGDRKVLHRNFSSSECPAVPPCNTFIIKCCCINRT